eukprot:m.414786 g.414786  ORF g.414786 m.414786 type:complete len:218 (-) comp29425_c0_seq1:178-831(-)
MAKVYWGWHPVAGATVHNFQHWLINVEFEGDDTWFENTNSGVGANGKQYKIHYLPTRQVKDELVSKERTSAFRYKYLGKTTATKGEIIKWCDEFIKSRVYDLGASVAQNPGDHNQGGPPYKGNCQTLVWFLASRMKVLTGALQSSDYSDAYIMKIPQPGSAPQNQCSVVQGACTGSWVGSSYTSVWCDRCGHWYCPYHETPSAEYVPAGSCHTCYSG